MGHGLSGRSDHASVLLLTQSAGTGQNRPRETQINSINNSGEGGRCWVRSPRKLV